METVTACRWCGTAIYLHAFRDRISGTGPDMNEHWRHIEADERYCVPGNGTIAEPYDGSGPIAAKLRDILSGDVSWPGE